jgi:hypothetical protein
MHVLKIPRFGDTPGELTDNVIWAASAVCTQYAKLS